MEIEIQQRSHDEFNIHRKVKEIAGMYKQKSCEKLVNRDGNIIIDLEEKKTEWKNYIENLFQDTRPEELMELGESNGSSILIDEVRAAIN